MIRIETSEQNRGWGNTQQTMYCVMIWRNKAKNPYINGWYSTPEKRQECIEREQQSDARHEAFKAERRSQRQELTVREFERIQLGDIYYTSWGYDQTNVEWFKVVGKSGTTTVTLQEIGAKVVEETSWCSWSEIPDPDAHIGEPIKKRLSGDSFTIDECRTAWRWNGKPHHASNGH